MLDRIRKIIVEFELVISSTELLGWNLDDKRKDIILSPLKECVDLLKQVEKKLEEHATWAVEELDKMDQLD